MQLLNVTKHDRRIPTQQNRARWKDYDARPRLYISHKGENVLENLANRRSRPTTLYKGILPSILKELGLPVDTKVSWSQKAGCSCGCSPGFILKTAGRWNAWAEVTGERTADNIAALTLASDRARQILVVSRLLLALMV